MVSSGSVPPGNDAGRVHGGQARTRFDHPISENKRPPPTYSVDPAKLNEFTTPLGSGAHAGKAESVDVHRRQVGPGECRVFQ